MITCTSCGNPLPDSDAAEIERVMAETGMTIHSAICPACSKCDKCGAELVTQEEMELGLCETHIDAKWPEEVDDPAWQSEARLRNMEGVGDYEGPHNWP